MPIHTMFNAAEGQALWYAEFTVSATAPNRLSVWNRAPSGGRRPAEVRPYARRRLAAPAQPRTSTSVFNCAPHLPGEQVDRVRGDNPYPHSGLCSDDRGG